MRNYFYTGTNLEEKVPRCDVAPAVVNERRGWSLVNIGMTALCHSSLYRTLILDQAGPVCFRESSPRCFLGPSTVRSIHPGCAWPRGVGV